MTNVRRTIITQEQERRESLPYMHILAWLPFFPPDSGLYPCKPAATSVLAAAPWCEGAPVYRPLRLLLRVAGWTPAALAQAPLAPLGKVPSAPVVALASA